jgi:hypothetical protein
MTPTAKETYDIQKLVSGRGTMNITKTFKWFLKFNTGMTFFKMMNAWGINF